jgi:hypothetical protein
VIAWPVWGGIAVSPLIGALMGLLSIRFHTRTIPGQAVLALSSLYVAAALFGLAVGATDLAFGTNSEPGWHRIPSAVVLQSVVGLLWGLTFSGDVLFLWPLAWANHRIVAHVWRAVDPEVDVP